MSYHATTVEHPERLTVGQLDKALREADSAAILTPQRILRRVIKEHLQIRTLGLRVPHRKTYVIGREDLLAIVDSSELDLSAAEELPETVLLIARPTPDALALLTTQEALSKYWRLLFHARIHQALEQRVADGRLDVSKVADRIRRIGGNEFVAARQMMKQEDLLLSARSELVAYVEFAAVYTELRYFSETLLPYYFPNLEDLPLVDDILREDVDAEMIFQSTRLPGANLAPPRGLGGTDVLVDKVAQRGPAVVRQPSAEAYARLLKQAERVGRLGNHVRSSILYTRAAQQATAEGAKDARLAARSDVAQLARRLQSAVGFSGAELEDWARAVAPLLEPSTRGIWTAEARLLYDLQKVCVDHERGVYALDLWGWITSGGKTALKRPLPGQRDVLVCKHLRNAESRLKAVRVSGRTRQRLAALLRSAVHRSEDHLRSKFQPVIEATLDEVHLVPQNLPERVARQKLVSELLDRVVERGFLAMGDLRDALSRNNLKLPDLEAAQQLVLGDQLLKADRALAARLDEAYRHGEIYLRLPQKLSSLAFGTRLGRFLTRYVALPFGGAFLTVEGVQHIWSMLSQYAGYGPVHLHTRQAVLVLGFFLLGLIHHQGFRSFCLQAAWRARQFSRRLLVDWPSRLLHLPLVQAIVRSPQFRLATRYVFKPLLIALIITPGIAIVFARTATLESGVGIFFIVNLLLNSRIGRNVDELVTDWVVSTWHAVRIHVFAAFFRLIMDIFNRILETIERLLYSVDEWLRFRAGENLVTTVTKAVLGMLWMIVNYVIRIYVNLLIEPQINPIKHFPVVTVSHKIILPFSLQLTGLLATPLKPFIGPWANAIAAPTVFLLPGVFGFLVWELKENWRLYAANRPLNLQPVQIGHHGETMLQFMKPGFRSGTVPKIYSRLRRASRKGLASGNWRSAEKQLENLHRVEEHLRRFIDREFVLLLLESRGWGQEQISTGEIHLGSNRILVELYAAGLSDQSLWLSFEEQAGWLVASLYRRGWLDKLSATQRRTLDNALAGFYKLAGVDLVREQIESNLGSSRATYEIAEAGLLVWPLQSPSVVLFELRNWPPRRAPVANQFVFQRERLDRSQLVFCSVPISWLRWVNTWQIDQLASGPKQQVLENSSVLAG